MRGSHTSLPEHCCRMGDREMKRPTKSFNVTHASLPIGNNSAPKIQNIPSWSSAKACSAADLFHFFTGKAFLRPRLVLPTSIGGL